MFYRPKDIPAIRKEAEDALRPAFARSLVHSVGDWMQRCANDTAQLWRNGDLWALTEVQQTHDGRAIVVIAMAGDYTQSLVAEIEAWAKSHGCKRAFWTGRRGWARKALAYDKRCRVVTVTMEKEL